MKKITKKTFKPNMNVEVIKNSFSFYGTIDKFETFPINNVKDLDIKAGGLSMIQPTGTKLTTLKMVNYEGSPRAIFKDSNGQMYQSFWLDFSKFVREIE